MNSSTVFAQYFGVVLLAVGLGMLLNKKHYTDLMKKSFDDAVFMMTSGIISLVIGMFIVMAHNVWTWSWEVLVTLFGWVAIYKGVMRTVFPAFSMRMLKKMVLKSWLMDTLAWGSLLLGALFTYFGFFS